jgi:hypothetical protein
LSAHKLAKWSGLSVEPKLQPHRCPRTVARAALDRIERHLIMIGLKMPAEVGAIREALK